LRDGREKDHECPQLRSEQLPKVISLHLAIVLSDLKIFVHLQITLNFSDNTMDQSRQIYQTFINPRIVTGIDEYWPRVEASVSHLTLKKLAKRSFAKKENGYAIGLIGRMKAPWHK
jgi:hypothetical protein